MSERINARLSQPLAEFVDRMVGEAGLYETPSEYVRDLIRREQIRAEKIANMQRLIDEGGLAGFPTGRSIRFSLRRKRSIRGVSARRDRLSSLPVRRIGS